MSMLKGLFNNPSLKKLLLKQFTEIVKQEKIRTIVIPVSESGEMGEPEMFTEETKTIPLKDYNTLINSIQNGF